MARKDRLYDAFGELIYAVAKADGIITQEETRRLDEILEGHPWASEIRWSFDYENEKQHSVEAAYEQALDRCIKNGPDAEYAYLLEILDALAKVCQEGRKQEEQMINDFKTNLTKRFREDLEKNQLNK